MERFTSMVIQVVGRIYSLESVEFVVVFVFSQAAEE